MTLFFRCFVLISCSVKVSVFCVRWLNLVLVYWFTNTTSSGLSNQTSLSSNALWNQFEFIGPIMVVRIWLWRTAEENNFFAGKKLHENSVQLFLHSIPLHLQSDDFVESQFKISWSFRLKYIGSFFNPLIEHVFSNLRKTQNSQGSVAHCSHTKLSSRVRPWFMLTCRTPTSNSPPYPYSVNTPLLHLVLGL